MKIYLLSLQDKYHTEFLYLSFSEIALNSIKESYKEKNEQNTFYTIYSLPLNVPDGWVEWANCSVKENINIYLTVDINFEKSTDEFFLPKKVFANLNIKSLNQISIFSVKYLGI